MSAGVTSLPEGALAEACGLRPGADRRARRSRRRGAEERQHVLLSEERCDGARPGCRRYRRSEDGSFAARRRTRPSRLGVGPGETSCPFWARSSRPSAASGLAGSGLSSLACDLLSVALACDVDDEGSDDVERACSTPSVAARAARSRRSSVPAPSRGRRLFGSRLVAASAAAWGSPGGWPPVPVFDAAAMSFAEIASSPAPAVVIAPRSVPPASPSDWPRPVPNSRRGRARQAIAVALAAVACPLARSRAGGVAEPCPSPSPVLACSDIMASKAALGSPSLPLSFRDPPRVGARIEAALPAEGMPLRRLVMLTYGPPFRS